MELIRLTDKNLKDAAHRAADVLRQGGIVAYPTDTIYGLAVDPWNSEALERMKELKGRERKKPISVLVPDVHHIKECGELTPSAKALAEKFLPGPLTLVVPAKSRMPEGVMLNGTIGIRIPNDPFCLALAKAYGQPFTTTSANKAGMAVPDDVEGIMREFARELHHIALIVDGGPRKGSTPSTVVSCVGDTPYVLREGALSKTDLGL